MKYMTLHMIWRLFYEAFIIAAFVTTALIAAITACMASGSGVLALWLASIITERY
jgi:hypothetical protein